MAVIAPMSSQPLGPLSHDGEEAEPRAREERSSRSATIRWAAWDVPDRIAASQDIKNETGDAKPRLMLITYKNGAIKVSATRRPSMMLTDAARIARAMGTWIDGALVSEPDVKLGLIAQTLVKRLRLAGHRYIGSGVFERLVVDDALATLAQIRAIDEPPDEPRVFRPETDIPTFLRKENRMTESIAYPTPQPAGDGLIPVFQGVIGGVACNVCDARTLHAFLEVGKDFTTWIKDRIQKYQFVENQDFAEFSPDLGKIHRGRGRPSSDYHLTLDMAKELSMVENNEKGRQARRYFIECERRAQAALGATQMGDQEGLPKICEEACDARAWFLFNQVRELARSLLGSAAREGDDERLLDGTFWVKTRIHERLREQARRQLAGRRDSRAVAAWILAWTPDRPALA